jgi:hypothetical protein
VIHPEETLKTDACVRVLRGIDLEPFFGFDGLVQALAPCAIWHHAACELIHNNDFSVINEVMLISKVKLFGRKGLVDYFPAAAVSPPEPSHLGRQRFQVSLALTGQFNVSIAVINPIIDLGLKSAGDVRCLSEGLNF